MCWRIYVFAHTQNDAKQIGGCSKSKKTLTAKVTKDLRKDRNILILKQLFFASFAKNLASWR